MEKTTVTRDSDKFMLRFPDGMRDRIREAAEANGRSMNAEIVQRLQDSFSENKQAKDDELADVGKAVASFVLHHMGTPTDQLPDGLKAFVRRVGAAVTAVRNSSDEEDHGSSE